MKNPRIFSTIDFETGMTVFFIADLKSIHVEYVSNSINFTSQRFNVNQIDIGTKAIIRLGELAYVPYGCSLESESIRWFCLKIIEEHQTYKVNDKFIYAKLGIMLSMIKCHESYLFPKEKINIDSVKEICVEFAHEWVKCIAEERLNDMPF